jgi:hypothetical protein
MGKIVYTPALLTQLCIVKKATFELVRINEDKSGEQLLEEIETVKNLLEETKHLVNKQKEK